MGRYKSYFVEGRLNYALMNKVCGMWGNYNGVPEVGIEVHQPGDPNSVLELNLQDLWVVSDKTCDKNAPNGNCAESATHRAACEALNDAVFSNVGCHVERQG